MERPTCILITGIPHAGTRLLVQMLNEHPDVSVPMRVLNPVMEHAEVVHYFHRIMDATPMHSSEYLFDDSEMRFYMEMYKQTVDLSKPYYVFKAPIYPMLWLDWLVNYFEGQVKMVFTTRSSEMVVKSFVNKGQDKAIFWRKDDNVMMTRFMKHLPPDRRMHYMATYSAREYLYEMIEYYESLRANWDANHPELPFVIADVENVTATPDSLRQFIQSLGLREVRIDSMYKLVDHDRLFHHSDSDPSPNVANRLKGFMQQVTPPVLWSLARRLLKYRMMIC
jgi:hypothetical protein